MKISWFFEEISSQTSPETLSVARECCLGHFSWKIFLSIFQLLFWIMFFAQFRWNFHDFWSNLEACVRTFKSSTDITYENHWFFDEIEQKSWSKIGVGKLIKIFFMRNAPNNILWSVKVSPMMPETIFPRKTMIFSWFSCFRTIVGISIVNARIVVSLYGNAHF